MPIDPTQRPEYFAFASRVLDDEFVHGPATKCLASVSQAGQVQGVVIYDRIDGWDCMAHVASNGNKRWLNRQMRFWMFHVPFVQYGLRRMTGIVHAGNLAALRFDLHLGFEIEGRMRCAFADGADGIVLGMLRENCRFLNQPPSSPPRSFHHGKEEQNHGQH